MSYMQAVSLDAVGTLIQLDKSPQEIYYMVLLRHGIDTVKIKELKEKHIFHKFWLMAEEELPPLFRKNLYDRFTRYQDSRFGFWGLLFETMFNYFGLPKENMATILEDTIVEFADTQHWQLEPTALKLLQYCQKEKIPMFVTSNFDEQLPNLLNKLNIADYFQEIITSAGIGYEKPSPHIFKHLIEVANCPPQKIIHVGDTFSTDIEGALQAGIVPVMIDGKRKKVTTLNQKTTTIHALEQVIALL